MTRFGRYTIGARCYDVVSLEWPVYWVGRQAAIDLLDLQPGDRVLDIGCGTGLNFPLLDAAIGPSGTIVGVDLSASMLAQAWARVESRGWRHVSLVQANAGVRDLAVLRTGEFDAIIATYALSVIEHGENAWYLALRAARPGARVAIADLALPTGRWRTLTPFAWLACLTGGVAYRRRPWQWVERDTENVDRRSLRGGHIQVAAGTASADLPTRAGI